MSRLCDGKVGEEMVKRRRERHRKSIARGMKREKERYI